MGVAIFFIMLFHSGIVIKHPVMLSAFRCGDIGVEMFAVLSAIGVSFSLSHNPSTVQFYKRRLLRVFPTYLAVAIPYALFLHFKYGASWGHVASLATGMSTFRGDVTFWFVSYIMVCYLFAPLFIIVKRKIHRPFVLTGLVLVLSYALFRLLDPLIDNCNFWCLRFPAFALGCDLYDYVNIPFGDETKRRTNVMRLLLSAVALIISIFLSYFVSQFSVDPEFSLIGYFAIVVPLLFFLSNLLSLSKIISRIFACLGGITLELYLVHEHIALPIVMHLQMNVWIIMVAAMVIAVALSVCIKTIVSKLLSKNL